MSRRDPLPKSMFSDHPRPTRHSFVVLAYRNSPYLEACLTSLRRQTVPSDILVATSTPSRFVEQMAAQYGLPLLINANSRGIASDWNFAYAQGRTDYVTLAHQDDAYLPRYTELCLAAAERCPDNLITFTDYREMVDGQVRKDPLHLRIKRLMLVPYYLFRRHLAASWLKTLLFLPGNPLCCPSVMYHKARLGAFEFDVAFAMNLDWEAWLRLARMKGDFIYLKQRMVLRRIHPESATTQALRDLSRQREDFLLFDRLWPKCVAPIMAAIYARAYESNRTPPSP